MVPPIGVKFCVMEELCPGRGFYAFGGGRSLQMPGQKLSDTDFFAI